MSARINIGDLKSQIAKRVGPDLAQQYFGYLNQLLSRKLSKHEFNKLCVLTLGRENLHLHNQLVRSVLKNACQAKAAPSSVTAKALQPAVWSNGDVLPQSPRRSWSGFGGRRIKDRPSPLGPNGREHLLPHKETVRENGVMGSCDLKRPVQLHESAQAEQLAMRPRLDLVEAVHVEKERDDLSSAKLGPLQAPLGIPFCPPSIGGARRGPAPSPSNFDNFGGCSDSDELLRTEDLRICMQRIAEGQGLGGVALDCAHLLNNGLNAYLKRLIKASAELAGTSTGQSQMKQQTYKHHISGKPINGIWQGSHLHLQGGGPPLESQTDLMNRRSITMQDFRVAMEMNPQQLGEDWPLLLEKISHHSADE